MKNWKQLLAAFILGVAMWAFFAVPLQCSRHSKQTEKPVKKQGKPILVSTEKAVSFDTLKWMATYKANTKPRIVYRYLKPELSIDTTRRPYSPCDSTFTSLDSGTVNGVKFEIIDTTSNNKITGRSIKLRVQQEQVTKHVETTNSILRVDTVYITSKQPFGTNSKWFLKGFILGNITGFVIPK